jgi:hypothetical protein
VLQNAALEAGPQHRTKTIYQQPTTSWMSGRETVSADRQAAWLTFVIFCYLRRRFRDPKCCWLVAHTARL